MVDGSENRVGVGTTTPVAALQVRGGIETDTLYTDTLRVGEVFLLDPLLPELTNDSVLVWSGDTVGYRGVAFLSGAPTLTPTANIADGNGATELNGAQSVFVQGDYAYVIAKLDDGMEIFDISDPSNIVSVGSVTDDDATLLLEGANDVFVRGKYAYVSTSADDGLQIFDISDPSNIVPVGQIADNANGATVLDNSRDLFVQGIYAYVTSNDANGSVQVIDISDPANPRGVGAISDNA